jgi:hypothetical protein
LWYSQFSSGALSLLRTFQVLCRQQELVFDTSSLQVLVNLSELVARQLESEIVLAKQQYQLLQLQQQTLGHVTLVDAVTRGLLARQQLLERYQLLLRTIDCVTRWVRWRRGGGAGSKG